MTCQFMNRSDQTTPPSEHIGKAPTTNFPLSRRLANSPTKSSNRVGVVFSGFRHGLIFPSLKARVISAYRPEALGQAGLRERLGLVRVSGTGVTVNSENPHRLLFDQRKCKGISNQQWHPAGIELRSTKW